MKHSASTTAILISIFVLAQLIGLITLDRYYQYEKDEIIYEQLPLGLERPEVQEEHSWIYITLALLFGTMLMLGLIRYNMHSMVKLWLFLAVTIALILAFSAYMPQEIAVILAISIAFLKIRYQNMYIHNMAEIFMYGGIAVLFHEMLSVTIAALLLIIIAGYDMFAVWKSKHMVKMANYQTAHRIFAGAMVAPFEIEKKSTTRESKKKQHKKVPVAILGGGDIAFPLLFAGAIMKTYSINAAFIIVICTTIALTLLFIGAKKGKFYPAIPFLTIGCFVGWGIISIISLFT